MKRTAAGSLGGFFVGDVRRSRSLLARSANRISTSRASVDDDAFRKVESDLIEYGKQIEALWKAAWDQRNAEIAAMEAALRAEKAAPGSAATLSKADAVWTMLRGLTAVMAEQCVEAGYPPRRFGTAAVEPAVETSE